MFRKKREQKEVLEQDITALMDIVTIIVVFLLTAYTASDVQIKLAKNLEMVTSLSEQMGRNEIIVQLASDGNIYLKDELIGSIKDDQVMVIPELFDKLKVEKELLEEKFNQLVQSGQKQLDVLTMGFSGEEIYQHINLVIDKTVPYKNLKKIFTTTAAAGFPKYRLIVTNEV